VPVRTLAVAVSLGLLTGCLGDTGYLPNDDTAGGETVLDDTPSNDTTAVADTTREPIFELGTNATGEAQPSAFTGLGDGDTLEIVYGPQGLWMVVLAFRTRGLVAGPVDLNASILVDGAAQGQVTLAGQTLVAGPQGLFYFYNIFLVVNDPTVAGQKGTILFKVTDTAGHIVDHTVNVALSGGL